jgi:hypothetical protein
MLLMAIIPEVEITKPLLEVLVGNAGISGLALLVTALAETVKKQLSLYHAIFIIHMLYFTGIMVVPSGKQNVGLSHLSRPDLGGFKGKYEGNKINFTLRILISFVMTYGSVMLFTGYAFYVWATAPTFGTNPECNNEIKYIFFFRSVRATVGWLRKLWMVGLGATLGLMILVPLASCLCLCFLGSAGGGRSSIRKNTVKYSKPLYVQRPSFQLLYLTYRLQSGNLRCCDVGVVRASRFQLHPVVFLFLLAFSRKTGTSI